MKTSKLYLHFNLTIRSVRKAASACIIKWVGLIENLYSGLPNITRSRNYELTLGKLKESYPLINRVKKSFTRSLRRKSSIFSESEESGSHIPVAPYINRNIINAQREAKYRQSIESKLSLAREPESADESNLYHISEVRVTAEAAQDESFHEIKENNRVYTEEDLDLDVNNLRL